MMIDHAKNDEDFDHIRDLFIQYHKFLGVDLSFQGFEQELNDLPGKYDEPNGCLLLAREGVSVAGVVGVWPLQENVCEMKRLFVRPFWRGKGFGRLLAEAVLHEARERGYSSMLLDTLPQLIAARTLYISLGFKETEAYYDNPLKDVSYLKKELK